MIAEIEAYIKNYNVSDKAILDILGSKAMKDGDGIEIGELLYGDTEEKIENIVEKLVKANNDIAFDISVYVSGSYNNTAYKVNVKDKQVLFKEYIGAAEDEYECPKCGATKELDMENLSFDEWEDLMMEGRLDEENPTVPLVKQFESPYKEINCPKCGVNLHPYINEKKYTI